MPRPTWLGGPKPVPPKSLFLYDDPFIIDDTVSTRQDVLLDYLGETERGDLDRIYAMLWRFAEREKLVDVAGPNEATQSKDNNLGSWIWAVNWTSFRGLVVMQNYGNLMDSLQARDGYPLTQIIELHNRLGMLYDSRLLNTLVHRVMTAIQTIPYPRDTNQDHIEWDRIHIETPFVWIIILLQNIIRQTTKQFAVK